MRSETETTRALQEEVAFYDVLLWIESPVPYPDVCQFLPTADEEPELHTLLSYIGIEPDTESDEWPAHQWNATLSAQQLSSLLELYAIDERIIENEQRTIEGVERIIQCLTFEGVYVSRRLNSVRIYTSPQIEGRT